MELGSSGVVQMERWRRCRLANVEAEGRCWWSNVEVSSSEGAQTRRYG